MSDNSQELFIPVPQGTLDIRYQENGILQLWRDIDLICEGEATQNIVDHCIYDQLNFYSMSNPDISKEELIGKIQDLVKELENV